VKIIFGNLHLGKPRLGNSRLIKTHCATSRQKLTLILSKDVMAMLEDLSGQMQQYLQGVLEGN